MQRYHAMFVLLVVALGAGAVRPAASATGPEPPVAPTPIPGTSVALVPPPGFLPADRFTGFMDPSTGASILVTELPGPFAESTAGFTDEDMMWDKGMRLLAESPAEVDGHPARLYHIAQAAHGLDYLKWTLAVDLDGSTVLIAAVFPESQSHLGDTLRAAIHTAVFGDAGDPMDALAFTVTPVAPFETAQVMAQNLILTLSGGSAAESPFSPIVIVALSMTDGLAIPDHQAFAEQRAVAYAPFSDLVVDRSTPTTVGPLSGFVTRVHGIHTKTSTPVTLSQTMLFDEAGYCLITGVTPTAQRAAYLPAFGEIAASFRMKE